jgi:non-ribosomal peptide synthetase component F
MDYLGIMHKAAQEYWRNALADGPCTPFPVLPVAIEDVVVDNKLEHQILLHGTKAHDITPPYLIRAAWALVASRAAYSNDVVFGIVVSGSDELGGAVVTGDAVASPHDDSMVPVRVRMAGDQAVLKYLQGIQQQAQEMVPFESVGLQQIANLCPDNQQACTFQALLDIQTQQGDETAQTQQQKPGINKHALRLTLRLGLDSIMASASFDSRVVSSQTMQNLMQQFDTVLTQLYVATPTQKLMDIQMVTKEDLERIWDWNGSIPASMDRCIHDTHPA